MGAVYEAFDREREQVVALKAVRARGPDALARFKSEFRALADVVHPNLVRLYELEADGEQAFFTMELVDGASFLDWVWERSGDESGDWQADSTWQTALVADAQEAVIGPRGRPTVSLSRLRSAARQLAEAVEAIHSHGFLHCDLKPSNVLVDGDGRVVVLDFGLITELPGELGTDDAGARPLRGTAAYMSPEQAARISLSPASDWYSVGAILYVALTGRTPFIGASRDVLVDKQQFEPPRPSEVADEVPDDLDQLCAELLRREPEARPHGNQVLRRLGSARARSAMGTHSADGRLFIGRQRELGKLFGVLEHVRAGGARLVRVAGESGVGKTALCEEFCERAGDTGALVLTGRCYERETMPYKALDGVIDGLVEQLALRAADDRAALLPADAPLLARIFPAFRRLGGLGERGSAVAADAYQQRRRAFAALRELCFRLGESEPLVLWVDDLQWGDVDSAPLLEELLREPDAPRLLLLLSFRAEARGTAWLVDRAVRYQGADLELGPLPAADAEELAELYLAQEGLDPAIAPELAREAAGHPYLIEELSRFADARSAAGSQRSLDRLIARRFARLPSAARALLTAAAVSGRPTPLGLLAAASSVARGEIIDVVRVLRVSLLLRATGVQPHDLVEPYHDRIRETVAAQLGESDAGRIHGRLADALLAERDPDVRALTRHLAAAGRAAEAADYALQAAEQAARSLAFDRAAALYRQALRYGDHDGEQTSRLQELLGGALYNAGRGEAASAAFLEAAGSARPNRALELHRRAALSELQTGHLDRGLALLRGVLDAHGFALAATPRRALWSLALLRLRFRLRGPRFRRRDEAAIAPATLARIDVCVSTALGLGMADFVRAAEFQTRGLLLALRSGEPGRIARSLALEIVISGVEGRPVERRLRKLLARLQTLATEVDDPLTTAWVSAAEASIELGVGNFATAAVVADRSVRLLHACSGTQWEIVSEELFRLWALYYLGRWHELEQRIGIALSDADLRGDLYTKTNLRIGVFNALWLMRDDPDGAEHDLADALAPWPDRDFHLQHYWALSARIRTAIYRGHGARPLALLDEAWPRLERSMFLRISPVRIEATHLRARAALVAAREAGGDPALWARAEADARRLVREKLPWADALAAAVRGSVAAGRGDRAAAASELAAAAAGFAERGMQLWEIAARFRAAELGSGQLAALRQRLRSAGVRNPESLLQLMIPV